MECSAYHTISVVVLLLLLMSACDCQKYTFYIRPSDSSHCPEAVNASQCYDLSDLVSERHLSMSPNAFLLFLPGEHFLEKDLDVKNIEKFQMTPCYMYGDGNSSIRGVKITCTGHNNYGGHSVKVQNVSFVKINSISFQSCGVDVDSSGVLQLKSVYHSEITNCKWYESRSSAIFIQDTYDTVISDCQFTRASCSNCSGGGIYAASSNVTFTGSNAVTENSVSVLSGGGLSFVSSCVYVDGNLTVDGNFASIAGGGMYLEYCTFTATNASLLLFQNNRVYSEEYSVVYISTKTTVSLSSGGGMSVSNSHCAFNGHVEFSGNSVGGMEVNNDSYCTFNGSVKFSGNSANYGGGLEVRDDSYCTFNGHVEFSNNSAAIYGGGMEVRHDSYCTFNGHVEFSSNSANYGGGLEVRDDSCCTFNGHVEFSNNSAAHYGGGMEVRYDSCCTFNGHVEFFSNNATDNGGGMIVNDGSQCTFNGQVEFSGNSAIYGGGMEVFDSSNSTFNGHVEFSGNSAVYGGGMGVRVGSNCTFSEHANFSGNSADSGGGMYVHDGSNCTFKEQVDFADNSAISFGGGMEVEYNSNCAFNGHVEFSGNSAEFGGGLDVIFGSNCIFNKHVSFHGNIAVAGGGMYVFYYSNCTFKEQVDFTDNSAVYGGGMEIKYNSNCAFKGHVEFSGNSAEFGGGLDVIFGSNCIFNKHVSFHGNVAVAGGGMYVFYYSNCTFKEQVDFTDNSAVYGGGMEIKYNSNCAFKGHVEFSGNSADFGGGVNLIIGSNCAFNKHVNFSDNSAAYYGGGMRIYERSQCIFKSTTLFLGNNAGNSGGSLCAELKSTVIFKFLSEVTISNSTAGWEGGGTFVGDDSLLEMSGETIMESNHASSYGGAISLESSTLRIEGASRMTSNYARYGGAIQAISSEVHISGDHHFENNKAYFGGGWSLSGGTLIYVPFIKVLQSGIHLSRSPKLTIQFISNHAEKYGGAVWVENSPYYSCSSDEGEDTKCFVKVSNAYVQFAISRPTEFSRVIAINNTAIAGSNIYGGNTDSCFRDIKDRLHIIMPFLNESNSISSDPNRVCLCKYNRPDCSSSKHSIEAFSGERFTLTLVGAGQYNGTVPAVILSHTEPPGSHSNGSVIQSATGSCSDLFYTVASDEQSVKLKLYPESLCLITSLHILTVNVTIKPCPPGFMLHDETKSCVCDNALKKLDNSIQCDINSQSFSHQHGVWIGYNQLNGTVTYHPYCPFDYCTQEVSTFTLNNTDNQCRYNRSRLICGACREGYSITLGGSKCRKCSHVYLVLFIPLALAGVVLVLFLLIFKLTVSLGTINGLIFFANIIGANSSIFLPPETTVVLRVFIAWLNLDLGIDTCLFDGLDMYMKVWLQFVFPFYVFTLIAIIIFISQRSTLVTKLLGSDPVAVLATLILVAYTKLFRAILTVMSFTNIRGFDGSSIAVWLYDGNVKYMSGKHIALVLFSLLITLLLIIPYTVILLFAPYLQHYSKTKVLFWINNYRLKSFLHSYYAPLKDKYRSWIGLLLVLRLCLLIVFVSNSLGDPSINLFAITAAVILVLCWRALSGIIYTNWCHDALELFFIMKLGIFSVSTLYVLHTSGNQRALADTIIGVTFIIFVAITVYHSWRQLTDSRWWRLTLKPKWQKYFNSKNDLEEGPIQQDDKKCAKPLTPPQVSTTFIELREPVLEFN